jgi:hypothetical protein
MLKVFWGTYPRKNSATVKGHIKEWQPISMGSVARGATSIPSSSPRAKSVKMRKANSSGNYGQTEGQEYRFFDVAFVAHVKTRKLAHDPEHDDHPNWDLRAE